MCRRAGRKKRKKTMYRYMDFSKMKKKKENRVKKEKKVGVETVKKKIRDYSKGILLEDMVGG